jgi:NAD(P)-dependent dehydrogenase (short-subunit alcohol dehydrogenase family)
MVLMQCARTAEDVAHANVWLLPDESSYSTGAVIDVTGGK